MKMSKNNDNNYKYSRLRKLRRDKAIKKIKDSKEKESSSKRHDQIFLTKLVLLFISGVVAGSSVKDLLNVNWYNVIPSVSLFVITLLDMINDLK